MFQFLVVIGGVLAFYGYTVMKNPNAWGDQGRRDVKTENWNGYVVQNGQFFMYSGLFMVALAALDVIVTLPDWLFVVLLLGGVGALFWPLSHWMKTHEGRWWPWPRHETEKQKRARKAKEAAKEQKHSKKGK